MRHKYPVLLFALVLLGLAVLPASSSAQTYNYTAALMAGIGGSLDADFNTGYDNFGFQAMFGKVIRSKTLFSVRAGEMSLEADNVGIETDLSYLTLAGEYQFPGGFYESGLFLGLGFYDLTGDFGIEDDTGLGFTLGSSGDFRVNEDWSILVELSGHFADLDYAKFFLMGHVGVAYHF